MNAVTNNDYLAPIVAKLTINGAINLRASINRPHDEVPDLVNSGHRLFTGLGKWTYIAALGVRRHLVALGLAEERYIDWNKDGRGWKSLCMTPLGRSVAEYLHTNWDALGGTFRD